MIALQPLQSAFKAYLLHSNTAIAEHVQSTETASNHERLNIYHYGYRARLRDALAADFEVLKQLLGDEGFETLANDYIDTYPSQNPSLRAFGEQFANYIAIHPIGQQSSYLSELAQLEWGLAYAFDAQNATSVNMDTLLSVPASNWPEAKFKFHPSVIFLPLVWNVTDIWTEYKNNQTWQTFKHVDDNSGCVIWRFDLSVQYRNLSPSEVVFLSAAQQDTNFGELCELLLQWYSPEETVNQAAQYVTQWVQMGMLMEIKF